MEPELSITGRRWRFSDIVLVVAGGFIGIVLAAIVVGPDMTALQFWGVVAPAQYLGYLVALRWVLRRRNATATADLGFEAAPGHIGFVGLGIALQIALALLLFPLVSLLDIEETPQTVVSAIREASDGGARLAALVVAAILVPVAEELLFRGLLLRYLEERTGPRTALVGSALVFAGFHLLGVDFANFWKAAAVTLPQLTAMGLVLGHLVQKHGTLGRSIFTHAGFNLLAVIVFFLPTDVPGL